MALINTSEISLKLNKKLNSIDTTRKRIDRLFSEGKIYGRDIDLFYESMFLKCITSFEYSLESMFIGVLYQKYKLNCRRKLPKVLFEKKSIAIDIILNGKPFVEWMPIDKLENRAKIFFEDGFPFTCLNNSDKENLKQAYIIRNAIAHQSTFAYTKFKTKVVDLSVGLPDTNKTPAGYLRFVYRTGPDQTKFENFLLEISSVMNKIAIYS